MRALSLGGFLLAFWLALSGHYTPFLLAVGIASACLCTLIALRLRIVDEEGHPVQLLARVASYYLWLAFEIAKAGWRVARIVLNPRLPISPTLTRVKAGQRTTPGIATYANSITLTPGTVTVGVRDNVLTVHALEREGALDLESGRMDARISRFEGA